MKVRLLLWLYYTDSSSISDVEQEKVPVRVKNVKIKSIFDDEDDNDDFCDTIQIPAIFIDNSDSNNNSVDKQLKSEQVTFTAKFENHSTTVEASIEEGTAPAPTIWECEEDENCIAGQYFVQRTAFHSGQVQLLHDCFIPLVNGNWNGITDDKYGDKALLGVGQRKNLSEVDFEAHGLKNSVVPNCNHLEMEKLPKRSEDKVKAYLLYLENVLIIFLFIDFRALDLTI